MDIRSFFGTAPNRGNMAEKHLMALEDKRKIVKIPKENHNELADLIMEKITDTLLTKPFDKTKHNPLLIMVLPLSSVASIDGIKCDTMITISLLPDCQKWRGRIEFTLRMTSLMVQGKFDNDHVYFHESFYSEPETIHATLETILDETIVNLKYMPIMCKFVDKNQFEVRRLIDARLKKNGVDMCSDTCAVCFEITRAKTRCKHTICVPCADKITILAREVMDEDEPAEPCCPLCREEGDFHITF